MTPPKRKGFGTTIIERSVPYDLGGTAEIAYDPAGIRAKFCIPARHVVEPRPGQERPVRFKRSAPDHPQALPGQILKDQTVLLVEDSLIIALDAEDILYRLGAESVVTAATIEAALDAIENARPDLALLDINLGDRNSFPIAHRLNDLGIPLFFATGYGEQAQLPMEHRSRIVVQKPYTLEIVARAVHELIGDPAPADGTGTARSVTTG